MFAGASWLQGLHVRDYAASLKAARPALAY